jgi:hypothetical protein
MDDVNRQVRLVARPDGEPKPTDWAFTEEPYFGLLDVGAEQAAQASA